MLNYKICPQKVAQRTTLVLTYINEKKMKIKLMS